MATLEDRLKDEARRRGFELVGIAAAAPADDFDRLRDWLDRGMAGEMAYMHRHAEARRHPDSILPEVRSVVMVAMSYKPAEEVPGDQCRVTSEEKPAAGSSSLVTRHSSLVTAKVARY